MILGIVAFTEAGHDLADRIQESLEQSNTNHEKCQEARGINQNLTSHERIAILRHQKSEEMLSAWVQDRFSEKAAILFIGAAGIAVRSIAPFVQNKMQDSPVMVMDELGKAIIPILSGHVGGANQISARISQCVGAQVILTTATDVNGVFAVDVWAKEMGCTILNKAGIVKVSSKVLQGEMLTGLYSEKESGIVPFAISPDGQIRTLERADLMPVDLVIGDSTWEELNRTYAASLYLKPKRYVLGVGCRKDKSEAEIAAEIEKAVEKAGLVKEDIYALASIDKKAKEMGLLVWASKAKIPFVTYSGAELAALSGEFSASTFVEQTVGVDNVCERAAAAAGGDTIVLPKQANNGVTVAIGRRSFSWIDERKIH